jgi:hypothetical protein
MDLATSVLCAALAELRGHGVVDPTIEHGRHIHIRFVWRDRAEMVTIPRSPSDQNAVVLKLNDIRQQLGVKRLVRRSARPRKRRNRTRVSAAPRIFTVRPDPWAVLADFRGRTG